VPGGDTRRAIEELEALWRDLAEVERAHRLDFLRRPDAGLAWAAYRWAEGDDLAEVLGDSGLTAGDFVRWIKQLIDLSGQVADAAGGGTLRATARDVVRQVRRGVVAVAPLED
jgi:ATP-dependent RNA helicase HelY